jgi:hypothetical protein
MISLRGTAWIAFLLHMFFLYAAEGDPHAGRRNEHSSPSAGSEQARHLKSAI